MNGNPIPSPRGQIMMSYLPGYYQDSRVMRSIINTEGMEFDELRNALKGVLKQFFVNTADEWGLKIWETELGLPPVSQITLLERRQRIITKLRGYGTATVAVLKKVAESYENGQIEVAEDLPNYRITIRFVNPNGIPSGIDELKATLRNIIPAHLDVEFIIYNYFIWDEMDAKNWTWDQLDNLKIEWDNLEVYNYAD